MPISQEVDVRIQVLVHVLLRSKAPLTELTLERLNVQVNRIDMSGQSVLFQEAFPATRIVASESCVFHFI